MVPVLVADPTGGVYVPPEILGVSASARYEWRWEDGRLVLEPEDVAQRNRPDQAAALASDEVPRRPGDGLRRLLAITEPLTLEEAPPPDVIQAEVSAARRAMGERLAAASRARQ